MGWMKWRGGVAVAVAVTALLLAGAQAIAAKADDPPARRAPGKVTFHKAPSEESPAARERRLKRECKGRPNAGACLGFASR
ncbi:MAG: hypothetical protein GTN84_02000 [Hydrogenophaga sp.]|uniref:hypothetical protein n=1 Tax=Hydrogenophaga sp. TaxID=1904254 RepID=UPI00169F9905|nr:hypothetical protein [Hydrogenophaga sp.]NIM39925.1 hypothetical protein [Hydrogenophaga sp.]NIN25121.1 hypothetical protein [Hydrogenophaga sp.]NIN29688.1 hypothetical protein [Hydrogenophaga sp.]NIN54160.1 hypothetical protein [Hydrogenophaga sp.]NIO50573.1 hypothetical protein [Hydrogenophaga sp.]